jgi:hypothetical protein
MSNNKEIQLTELEQFTRVYADVVCSICRSVKDINPDDPENSAYENGYRVIGENCYCANCRNKKPLPIKKKK